MKYDFVFKTNCVELYKNGQWTNIPKGINQKNFRKRIVTWAKLAQLYGRGMDTDIVISILKNCVFV